MQSLNDILIGPQASILDAMQTIEKGSSQIVLVVDELEHLVGTVTDGDIRRGILRGRTLQDPVSTVMNANPLTSPAGQSRDAAIVLMRDKLIHQLPVVDKAGRVTGLVTLDGVLRELRQETLVVLMAGGLGTRLRPLTDATPKPLLPVGGRPLLEITIENLARQGFVNFALSVNYKADMFRAHFGSGEGMGVVIQYLQETERLGTAGALRLLPERPTAPVLMMNGDILTNLDARRLVQYHREQGAAITMCVREYEWKVPYGVVSMTNNYRVASLEEKPSRREFVNAGIYVVSPEAFEHLPPSGSIDMPTLIDKVAGANGAAAVYPLHEYWLDIGHLDDLQRAQEDLPGLFR
jgi:dTDP-glucose pyrophosphorylase/predicted transcriptional regulator